MKEVRYIIKVTATGTEHNPNEKFRGCVNIYYYGVDQTCIGHNGIVNPLNAPNTLTAHSILTYGYKSKAAANKATKFWTTPSKIGYTKFWEYTAEVLTYEFVNDVLTTPITNDSTPETDDSTDNTPTDSATPDITSTTPIRPSTNAYNLKARLFSHKYNDIVNTPTYENSFNDRRIAYNLYHIYLRDCAEMEKATSSPTTLPPIITSPSIRCAANKMLSETDAELESIVTRIENLTYNHKARSWEARK